MFQSAHNPAPTPLERFCYLFPSCGVTDLRIEQRPDGLSFFSAPHGPYNGFYQLEPERYRASLAVYQSVSGTEQTVPAALDIVCAFVSVANANRAVREGAAASASSYVNVIKLYETGIRLSGDESAIKMLGLIARRERAVTFCSTDDEITGLVPEPLRRVVAEALAGLALCALYEGRVFQCVGYATAALFKHSASLPMVACVRLVALARSDCKATVMLTQMVLLPYFLRSKRLDLYHTELSLWDPAIRDAFLQLPQQLASTAETLQARFTGRYGVVKAKLKDDVFVEKLCGACGAGMGGERLFSCKGCGRAYYCGRRCQLAHWREHKGGCGRAAVVGDGA